MKKQQEKKSLIKLREITYKITKSKYAILKTESIIRSKREQIKRRTAINIGIAIFVVFEVVNILCSMGAFSVKTVNYLLLPFLLIIIFIAYFYIIRPKRDIKKKMTELLKQDNLEIKVILDKEKLTLIENKKVYEYPLDKIESASRNTSIVVIDVEAENKLHRNIVIPTRAFKSFEDSKHFTDKINENVQKNNPNDNLTKRRSLFAKIGTVVYLILIVLVISAGSITRYIVPKAFPSYYQKIQHKKNVTVVTASDKDLVQKTTIK